MAIMILVLSCMPCSDAGRIAYGKEGKSRTAKTTPTSQEEEHQDLCSPFCQCSCCSIAYALPLAAAPGMSWITDVTGKIFATLIQQCPAGIASPVWQPPQLV